MLVAHPMLELQQNVQSLEAEVTQLSRRASEREREVRAPAAEAQAGLAVVKAQLAEEQSRLDAFNAELAAPAPRKVLTWARALGLAATLGAFTFGAAAAPLDLPHASIALFGATWVAFLAGALRGK